jgi:hypothetical protein
MKRDSFIFYKSFYALIKLLKPKERLKMIEAIFEYGFDNTLPDFNGDETSEAIWQAIFPQLKANQKRYENGLKGKESGVLGGRPKSSPSEQESYEELMAEFCVSDKVKPALWEFIQHCALNNKRLTNSKLETIIIELDKYEDDVTRVELINKAISGGFFDIRRVQVC